MQYEFASPAWVAALHGIVAGYVYALGDDAIGLKFTTCEIFSGAPPHLAGPSGAIAFTFRISGAAVDFACAESNDVDLKVVCDYQSVVPLVRYVVGGDPDRAAEFARMAETLIGRGAMRVEGDRTARPEALARLHDVIAGMTR